MATKKRVTKKRPAKKTSKKTSKKPVKRKGTARQRKTPTRTGYKPPDIEALGEIVIHAYDAGVLDGTNNRNYAEGM